MSPIWSDVESPMPAVARKCESLRTQHFLWLLATWKRQARRYGSADIVVHITLDKVRELASELIAAGCAPVCPPPINKGAPASVARPGSLDGQGGIRSSSIVAALKLTVRRDWLVQTARQLELQAAASAPARALLGQLDRHDEYMRLASVLCRAAGIRNIAERREFLRGNGVAA